MGKREGATGVPRPGNLRVRCYLVMGGMGSQSKAEKRATTQKKDGAPKKMKVEIVRIISTFGP